MTSSTNAATPAVCGAAIEVPFHEAVPLVGIVDRIPLPGATISKSPPKPENEERCPVDVIDPVTKISS